MARRGANKKQQTGGDANDVEENPLGTDQQRTSSDNCMDEDCILEDTIPHEKGSVAGGSSIRRKPRKYVPRTLISLNSRIINLCAELARCLRIWKRIMRTQFKDDAIDLPELGDSAIKDFSKFFSKMFIVCSSKDGRFETPVCGSSGCVCKKIYTDPPQLEKMTSSNTDGLDKSTPQSHGTYDPIIVIEPEAQSEKLPKPHVQETGELDALNKSISASSNTETQKNTKEQQTGGETACSGAAKRKPYTRKRPYTFRNTRGRQLLNTSTEELEVAGQGTKTPSDNNQEDLNQPPLIACIPPNPMNTDPNRELESMQALCQLWSPRTSLRSNGQTTHKNASNVKQPSDRLKSCFPSNETQRAAAPASSTAPANPTDKNFRLLLHDRAAEESAQPLGFCNRFQAPFFPDNRRRLVPNCVFSNAIRNHRPAENPIIDPSGRPTHSNQYGGCLPVHRQMLNPFALHSQMRKYLEMRLAKNNNTGE